jgi:Ni/Fe-hydrogenase subunit HybB-like protein
MGVNEWIETIWYIIREAFRGGKRYYLVALGLTALTLYGLYLWIFVQHAPIFLHKDYGGLILTGMNDSVPWGLYISFFIFWVGVAAAGIAFSIAAYVFNNKEFMKITVLAEVQAVAALIIVLMLIVVDLGRPIRALFLMPLLPNLRSMLDWDFIVITTYLLLNLIAVIVTVHYYRQDKPLPRSFIVPFMVIASPFAIGIHTVTAFISQALTARPAWNSPLLAPRYVATAFAAGPAILLIALYLAERYIEGFKVSMEVYRKTLYLTVAATVVGLYFTFSEAHEVFWYTTEPLKWAQARELFYGLHLPYLAILEWLWVGLGAAAVIIALIPSTHNSKEAIVFISALIVVAVIAEKTLTTLLPAFIPSTLGEVRPYHPTPIEYGITLGVHALGLLVYLALAMPAIRAVMTHYFKGSGAHH